MSVRHVDKLISVMTQRVTLVDTPKKVLQLRDRNVDLTIGRNGVLKPVMGKRFYKNKYTHVSFRGAVHKASISRGVFNSVIVWIE